MSPKQKSRPVAPHTQIIMDLIKNDLREHFVIENEKLVIPSRKEIENLLVKHDQLKKFKLNADTVLLAIKRHKSELLKYFEAEIGRKIKEVPYDNSYAFSHNKESTMAVLNLVLASYSVLSFINKAYPKDIFEEIYNREELAQYKDDLSPEKISFLIRNHEKYLRERRK